MERESISQAERKDIKIKLKQTKPVLRDADVIKHLEKLEASNNFAFICKKYCISKLLAEVSPNKNKNSTSKYSQTQNSKEGIIKSNIKYCKKVDLKITEQDKTFPIMYWLQKIDNTPVGARFMISKVLKMIFNHIESFHRKSLFYACFKSFGLQKIHSQLLQN